MSIKTEIPQDLNFSSLGSKFESSTRSHTKKKRLAKKSASNIRKKVETKKKDKKSSDQATAAFAML